MTLRLARPDAGVLFVVTGPSGVGKSTLVRAAQERVPGIEFSVSATTRAPRTGEVDGVDYHFVSREAFDELVSTGAMLEHATVYDRSYGTLREPVVRALHEGRSILLDVDAQGAEQVREAMPEAVHVFILPPSLRTLEGRLRARGTDSEETIQRRMAQVAGQLGACSRFDYLVMNDDLEAAHATFQAVLLAELCRRERRDSWVRTTESELAVWGAPTGLQPNEGL